MSLFKLQIIPCRAVILPGSIWPACAGLQQVRLPLARWYGPVPLDKARLWRDRSLSAGKAVSGTRTPAAGHCICLFRRQEKGIVSGRMSVAGGQKTLGSGISLCLSSRAYRPVRLPPMSWFPFEGSKSPPSCPSGGGYDRAGIPSKKNCPIIGL